MIDGLETLKALSEKKTMTAAANALRVSQSTVSKRIAALESELQRPLIEAKGRGVRLTAYAQMILQRSMPLVTALRESLLDDSQDVVDASLVLAVSESILASWGPSMLWQLQSKYPSCKLSVHAHRGPVVLERVRAGDYQIGLCAGRLEYLPDLHAILLMNEPMVLIPSRCKVGGLPKRGKVNVLSIEDHSGTGKWLRSALRKSTSSQARNVVVQKRLENFSAIVQMTKAGFGHGLVPLGIARAMAVPKKAIVPLSDPAWHRPVYLVARDATLGLEGMRAIVETMQTLCAQKFPVI